MTSLNFCFGGFPPSSHPHILTTTNPLPSAHCAWAGWDTGERNLWEDAVVIRSQIILTRGVSTRKKEISFRNYHEFFDKIQSSTKLCTALTHEVVDCRLVSSFLWKCLSIYNFISIIAHWMLHSAGHYYLGYEGYLCKMRVGYEWWQYNFLNSKNTT